MSVTAPAATAEASALVDLGLRACAAYGRDDLAPRLERVRRQLADPAVHIVVVGEFKKGKSSLVNALVGQPVCPIDDDTATAVPTHLRYAATPTAHLLRPAGPGGGALRREPVPLQQVRALVLDRGREEQRDGAYGVEVGLPSPMLAGGLVLVDTPGVGGLGSAHAAAALGEASTAQALVFVTDASQELTRAELDFLTQAREMCPRVVGVLTKTDLYPHWRQVRALTEEHLASAGVDAPVVAVSSVLRELAAGGDDDELDSESGFPALLETLARTVGDDAARAIDRHARAEVLAVCDQLEGQFRAERAALADPARARAVVEELNAVKARVQQLKSAASRWSRTLGDGVGDLNSDVDHDLRRRLREVLTEASEAIELSDPMDTWDQMESWLQARVSHELLGNYRLLRSRALQISEDVAEHFRESSGEALGEVALGDPRSTVAGEEVEHRIDMDPMRVRQQAMTMLKSAYGGSLMFIMLGTVVGVTLGPLAVGIALVMGTKGLRGEKQRRLEQRQRQAVAAVRQYLDQVSFVMGKDSRDALRAVQRQLRDHYTDLADQLERSNADAIKRATEASNRDEAERKRRLVDVDAELGRIRALRERAAR